jgi:hypothetical protein
MTAAAQKNWRKEFGIADWSAPAFFGSKSDIDAAVPPPPQAHALRRAFDRLGLTGVACFDNAPTVYFRESQRTGIVAEQELLRLFWNQGLAPILVVITETEVRIHSSLTEREKVSPSATPDQHNSLVRRLNRAADASEIRQFILSVQSGEFFRANSKFFDRKERVDRELLRNLRAAREQLAEGTEVAIDPLVLDTFLCRLVFTCYLFDRNIIDQKYLEDIGIRDAENLLDILGRESQTEAKDELYRLFGQLGHDLNGNLFNDSLDEEAQQITAEHLDTVNAFFHGTDVRRGQQSLWRYDFGVIPIETISAIYEHFLKAADEGAKKSAGAFYTPRFLAEMLLNMALEERTNLLNMRFLDPACGSGIFLVALFNRLAEEWSRRNPKAGYDDRIKGLTHILKTNLFGIDNNRTACRITAFSLYLAFLDQLSPPDIKRVLKKIKILPPLLAEATGGAETIRCADFFELPDEDATPYDLVVGNPPWKSETDTNAPSVAWCAERDLPHPDRQTAIAFAWKAPRHLSDDGRVCFVLPHGILFNHGPTALDLQQSWLSAHQVEVVLNLADFQRFLFEEAENPALVIRFARRPPDRYATVRYLNPKTDWNVTQAELVSIYPEDQTQIRLSEVLSDLKAGAVPLVWKERYWGTPRDWKLLDRMRLFPKLADIVGHGGARWVVGQGFQKPGPSDGPSDRKEIGLPTRNLMEARFRHFGLFLLEEDCSKLPSAQITVRSRSNTNTEVFRGPHVLITDGFKCAFAPFHAAFRQSVRGIRGPKADTKLLVFLSAYLNSSLASYYLFHTSANIGVERAKAESGDVLRLPFPLPGDAPCGKRADDLVSKVNQLYHVATRKASCETADRAEIIKTNIAAMTELVFDYFDIDPVERILIEDTVNVLMRSARRRKATDRVPTLQISTKATRDQYARLLCETLNQWASGSVYRVAGRVLTSPRSGLGVVVLDKIKEGEAARSQNDSDSVISVLERLERVFRRDLGTLSIVRNVKLFEARALYLTKPLSQRFWTRTAALNDADSIAAAILGRPTEERV